MTSDARTPRRDDPRGSIRSLDPVDPGAPPPDGDRLLQAVLATPRPPAPRRRRAGLLRLAPLGLALALVAAVVAVSIAGSDGSGDEQEIAGGSGGAAIIHYVVRETWGAGQPAFTHERWQLEDGSRARTVSQWEGEGPLQGTTTEDVVTSTQTLAYRPGTEHEPARIIRYRATDDFAAIPEDPPSFGAPPIGGSPEVGDPRALPARLADGDPDVTQLSGATIRGIAVERYRVGDCGEAPSSDQVVVPLLQRAVVALARDTHTPVRVTFESCPGGGSVGLEDRILDYDSFEVLPHTPANLERLELSPHPGVPVVDGIEIDMAEERDEAGEAPRPVPTPTPPPPPSS